ncbi:MAG: valine--tRNA ligase [Mucinivorans sp.]
MSENSHEIPAKYDPTTKEDFWYKDWLAKDYFHSQVDPSRTPYTIVIPPPNVTGVLHMGHMLNNTIQDVLVRRARMRGLNACWVPGTDHASIATEAKVVQKLAAEGIKKTDLTRQEFLAHAWQWKEKHGGIILEQLKKLGASCDWARTKFTMDDQMSASVIRVFVDLYNKGKIYRGVRMVNWDPAALTALSDEEVIFQEHQGKLYYLRYKIVDSDQYLIVATTRPETILGDTAVCVNPSDPRYSHLAGRRVIVPIVGREIPIIQDDYVDIEFGTGALKITPAHDVNDYMIGEKFGLEVIDIFNDNGTLNAFGMQYEGMDRFAVRDKIVEDITKEGLMEKIEDYTNKVGTSERSGAVIEPKLSMQWFLSMQELAEPALKAVMDDTIKLYPDKFKNTYRHWMENVRDWCVSRQLWWGQQIPAYYLPTRSGGGFVVAESSEEALRLAQKKDPSITLQELRQDPDVLDTWFSSWLWPISVFGGVMDPENEEIKYYYPTNDLVTAPEILFFWVARMVIAGYEYRGRAPFNNVYLTGIVRDKLRRKMSKSLGNSPDPLDLIAQFGADSVRVAMMLCSSAGNDIMWDDSLIEQGRNFGNKIWNSFRLIEMWKVDRSIAQPESSRLAVQWFDAQYNKTVSEIDADFEQYRISDALMKLYKLFWDDFSATYLELIKPAYLAPIDQKTFDQTITILEKLLQQLHPYMPFITEDIWHYVRSRGERESIMVSGYASLDRYDQAVIDRMALALGVVSEIRAIRASKNISPRVALELKVVSDDNYPVELSSVIEKLAGVSSIELVEQKPSGAIGFIVKTTEYFVPMAAATIDVQAEVLKLEKDLVYQQGFLASVMKKLENERFVSGAPERVLQTEYAKRDDALSKIASLTAQLAELSKKQ